MLAPPDQRRAKHDGGGVEDDDDHQPAQHLDRHVLTMKAATRTAGMPPMARPSTTRRSISPIWMWRMLAPAPHQAGARRHDREAQPRVHAHQAEHDQRRRIIADAEIEQNAEHEIGGDRDDRQHQRQAVRRSAAAETDGGWSSGTAPAASNKAIATTS